MYVNVVVVVVRLLENERIIRDELSSLNLCLVVSVGVQEGRFVYKTCLFNIRYIKIVTN